jgi:formylglycine-generating enzyme required for sulfatase activity
MASQTTSTGQVFISHATQDADFAHRLADGLKQLGVQVWIAPDSIRPGEGWVKAIERGLRESSHVVIVLTPAALESQWVEKETDVAIALERKGRIQILPLDVEACDVPLLLSSYQMMSFRRGYDTGFGRLSGVLGLSLTSPEPVRPPEMSQRAAAPQVMRPAITEPRQPFEPELVLIPAGEFLMGSDPEKDKYAEDDEQPQHRVYLLDYYIAKTPVTNTQYLAFVQAASYDVPEHWKRGKPPVGQENHPIISVSWRDAIAYCRWLFEVTGKLYRLPSEAEWEKGARGGFFLDGDTAANTPNPSPGRIYPWGDTWDAKWCNTKEGGKGGTTPVGAYPQGASPYGLLDMAGNVREWTLSLYRPYPYQSDDGREDSHAEGTFVLRGGAWFYYRRFARVCDRNVTPPGLLDINAGFRLVVAPV